MYTSTIWLHTGILKLVQQEPRHHTQRKEPAFLWELSEHSPSSSQTISHEHVDTRDWAENNTLHEHTTILDITFTLPSTKTFSSVGKQVFRLRSFLLCSSITQNAVYNTIMHLDFATIYILCIMTFQGISYFSTGVLVFICESKCVGLKRSPFLTFRRIYHYMFFFWYERKKKKTCREVLGNLDIP